MVVLWGAGDDRGYGDVGTFRQSSTFFYLTGVELPNAVLVLRQGEGGDLLFLPPRNPNVERWTGPKFGPGEETAAELGFGDVLSTDPSEIVLDARRRPVPGFESRLHGWLSEAGAVLWTELPPVSSGAVTALRSIKDAGEIDLMRQAIAITIEGQRRAAKALKPGVGEGVIDGVVYAAFREGGAEGLAFPSIVGSGYNATTLHYDQNVGTCDDGELVVIDIGARYGYYCGDLTRTYPANGRFTDRQREVYDLVLEAHDRAAEAMKPGVTVFDLRKIVYQVFEESSVRNSESEPLGQYFIHGLGHPLGLDAHDPGADETPLEAGMVITNEPGIYLPEEDGAEDLSAALPRNADDIEALMRGE
jgi:Xaa-Pro aminopeptidase